jgi:hypothetical protein
LKGTGGFRDAFLIEVAIEGISKLFFLAGVASAKTLYLVCLLGPTTASRSRFHECSRVQNVVRAYRSGKYQPSIRQYVDSLTSSQVRPGNLTEVKECALHLSTIFSTTDSIQNCPYSRHSRAQTGRHYTRHQELGSLESAEANAEASSPVSRGPLLHNEI